MLKFIIIKMYKKKDPNELLEQALPVSDDSDSDNEWYQYLKSVRTQALNIDEQLESHKDNQELHDSLATQYNLGIQPVKTTPQKSKGTGIIDCDEGWKSETLNYYNEMQQMLMIRRDDFKQQDQSLLYAYDYDVESLILNANTEWDDSHGLSGIDLNTRFKFPDTDDIAKCSEGFIHHVVRNILDLYEEEWQSTHQIPYELQMWIWSFLIMIEKPLIPDVAADLNDLLWNLERISLYNLQNNSSHHGNENGDSVPMDTDQKSYTLIDSWILVITEHFQQKFSY